MMPMIPAMPALIPASNTVMQASSNIAKKYEEKKEKVFFFIKVFHSLEEIEAKLSKELRFQVDVVKVSEESLKVEREKLEKLEKEYAIIR